MPATPPAPETPDITLAAAGSDLNLGSLIIDKAARPYVEQWFNDQKRPGDTPEKFLLRLIYQQALEHRVGTVRSTNTNEHAQQASDYQTAIQPEVEALRAALEILLP